jgi:pullulanase/glycogen debranching enzyme
VAAGDEWGRSQQGHDNAYDQDNEISWLDWSREDAALVAFTARLIGLRGTLPWLREDRWPHLGMRLTWLRADGGEYGPEDWAAAAGHLALRGTADDADALWLINTTPADVAYALPAPAFGQWRVALDTSAPEVRDAVVPEGAFTLGPDRVLVLAARETPTQSQGRS